MIGIVDARQPVIIVIVSDELAFLGKVGSLLGQHIAECIIRKGGDAACRMVHLGAAVTHVQVKYAFPPKIRLCNPALHPASVAPFK